jgi:tetratricopeptide (TPR) repeat protein
VKALMPPTYAELMASADEAHKKGGVVEAMGLYEKAAKADPSKKQPWSHIAQAQFDARNYGSAITAAQEVLQRDTTDVTAKSIMAVSGLRVSANALEQLRLANALGGNTREEAQTLARIMRDALGESILPAPLPTAASPADKAVARPPVRRVAPAPAAPVPAPAAEPKRNPFDALKG